MNTFNTLLAGKRSPVRLRYSPPITVGLQEFSTFEAFLFVKTILKRNITLCIRKFDVVYRTFTFKDES